MRKLGISGQNLVEIGVMIALVVGVFTSMLLYLQRGFQARYKAGADYVQQELANAAPAYSGLPRQYDPYYSESEKYENTTFNTLSGYPDSSVNDTSVSRAWVRTDIPWQMD